MITNYIHKQAAHCESGTISNLLRYHGLDISEPMAFGIGSGIFFAHMPFLKLNGIPGTTYRVLPGLISKRLTSRLGIDFESKSFGNNKQKAMDELDRVLDKGYPVGMLTSVFYLPYLPKAFRFHFNAHNLLVFGKENGEYNVSDPVMDYVTTISPKDLERARFPKGVMAPNGKMYYPIKLPSEIDFNPAIKKAIRWTGYENTMTPPILPFFGSQAISYLAKKVKNYPKDLDERKAILFLGNIVRMQEEIGTGGAGFRFMYAAFLQQASKRLQNPELSSMAKEMTQIGDQWRDFAFAAGRICKGRQTDIENFSSLSQQLFEIGSKEEAFFKKLRKLKM